MNRVPAVLVCDAGTGDLKIAGLSVLDRMVVTAHRAGCAPIYWRGNGEPRLRRARELDIELVRPGNGGPGEEPALMIEAPVLVETRDLARVIEANGHLAADRTLLPVRMSRSDAQPISALGVTHLITDAASARAAERKLWDSLGSSADGVIDRFVNRPLGRILSRLLVETPVSPNAVSVISILIGVAAAPLFARGEFVLGALVLQLCAIVDCVDGDLARALCKQSQLGKWLDLGGDQVVHFAVFLGIGVGVSRNYPDVPALALGVSAAIGVLLSFPVIIRGLRQPPEERGYLLQKLMDSTANRDFTVLLLLLALIGRVDLFLWMAGLGVHVFWILLLGLQMISRPADRRKE